VKRRKQLSAGEMLALRRKLVNPAGLRRIGQARERYKARLRSGWDRYENAIAAAYAADTDRLVDCLRANKPLADGDRDRLVTYIGTKIRRRCWPLRLAHALGRPPTADDYDLLADLVAKVGRERGRVFDALAHRAARLAEVLLSLAGPGRIDARVRTAVIAYACETEGDESDATIDPEQVRNLLSHPTARARRH
jgi:hypothetical protein